MINTAIEKVVDLLTEKYHILALIAKDIAAGAVLIASIVAFIIGALIFGPYVLGLIP
jgi:diacylglycerol kinase